MSVRLTSYSEVIRWSEVIAQCRMSVHHAGPLGGAGGNALGFADNWSVSVALTADQNYASNYLSIAHISG